jgi:hypothetical protein
VGALSGLTSSTGATVAVVVSGVDIIAKKSDDVLVEEDE